MKREYFKNKEDRIMVRELSPDFINDLLKGSLNEILDIIHKDDTLDLEIRNNYVNIYYRGGNILDIKVSSKNIYNFHFDENYLKVDNTKITKADLDNFINDKDWYSFFSQMKQIMDFYFSSHRNEEREYQQMVVRENNYSSISNGTDYFIIDIEYDNHKNARFDLVAVEWLSDASKRKLHKDYKPKLVVIEMKYGDQALSGSAGMEKHWNDYNQFISNKLEINNFKDEMLKVFEQKRELGLIPCLSLSENKNPITQLATDIELAFLIANHDPASSKLRIELLKYLAMAPKLITSNFMGYGIYIESIFELQDFINKHSKQFNEI